MAFDFVDYSLQHQQGQSVLSHQAGRGDPRTHERSSPSVSWLNSAMYDDSYLRDLPRPRM
jgi:hypothetical protein